MTVAAPELKVSARKVEPAGRGSLFGRLLRILAWQVVAILFVEGVLFLAGLGEEDIYKLDPVLGVTHMTNKRVTWRSEGYATSYFDADGMREPGLTIAKPPHTYRVALLGDSMVEGLQVPLEKTFGQLLDRELTAAEKSKYQRVQVLNFGTSGYSTAQEYLKLKTQVLKYSPDMVVLGYDTRDIFENWSPPDQTITNVRPIALHLPGGKLIVDSSSVTSWMKSPKARFLRQITWIREHSRIWGLIQATETELTFHDPVYRFIVTFITQPGKTIRQIQKDWPTMLASAVPKGPSFNIEFFEGHNPQAKARARAKAASQAKASGQGLTTASNSAPASVGNSEGSKSASGGSSDEGWRAGLVQSAITKAPEKVPEIGSQPAQATASVEKKSAADPNKTYVDLIKRTMGSLIEEMNNQCKAHGAKLLVFACPVREAMMVVPNLKQEGFLFGYADEVKIVSDICKAQSIPFHDIHGPATGLDRQEQNGLFYTVHLRPAGHRFIADQLYPFIVEQIDESK